MDTVIGVQDVDALTTIKDTFIHSAALQPGRFQLPDKVLVPDSACLLLPTEVSMVETMK
jgi:hypothetical protein